MRPNIFIVLHCIPYAEWSKWAEFMTTVGRRLFRVRRILWFSMDQDWSLRKMIISGGGADIHAWFLIP